MFISCYEHLQVQDVCGRISSSVDALQPKCPSYKQSVALQPLIDQ